ncbi:MAG: hypothetical protein U1E45_19980 [Geminicoccaceae bacterium]
MSVITNSMLLVRRIGELQRRRELLLAKQERLRRSLPEWAVAPLQLVGMSADEIRTFIGDLSRAEAEAGLDEIEKEIETLDKQAEDLENLLLTTPSRSLDSILAVLDLAVTRFRAQTVDDPNDVFYDYGDARVLTFLERAAEDLRAVLTDAHRQAS